MAYKYNEENINPYYKKEVQDAKNNKQNKMIRNSSLTHAIYLTSNLLDTANKNVRIFTGKLDETFFKYIKNKFEQVLERITGKLQIIILKTISLENKNELEQLSGKYLNKFNFLELKLDEYEDIDKINHFLTIDDSGYRIEEPHSETTITEDGFIVEAEGNFYCPEKVKILNEFFDKIVQK